MSLFNKQLNKRKLHGALLNGASKYFCSTTAEEIMDANLGIFLSPEEQLYAYSRKRTQLKKYSYAGKKKITEFQIFFLHYVLMLL